MKFQVFKEGRLLEKLDLKGAYLFGTDGIAISRSKISVKNGLIHCQKPNTETAGLSLLWKVEGFGEIILPTTCLPEREAPYILNVELARAKLMQIVTKREDWSFFAETDSLGNIGKQASELFIKAIQNIDESSKSSKLADEALRKSIVFSEKLAIKQSESLFEMRLKSHGFGRGCLGCSIDLKKLTNHMYIDKLLELFSFITIPINWGHIEKEKGSYDFSTIDACVSLLGKKRVALGGGPLLCFSKEYLPKWLVDKPVSFENIRDMAYKFVSLAVGRLSGRVRAWRVISGLNMYNHFGFDFEQILEMTRAANMAAKAANERSLKIIEVSNPWGEYYAKRANSIPPLVYMDMVIQSSITFDAFGLQMRFGSDESGMYIRDMMQMSAILDKFLPISKPLYITGVEIPGEQAKDKQGHTGGTWHKDWDQNQQSQWLEQFYKIALSKPFVDSVVYSSFADSAQSLIPSSGLLDEKLVEKKAFNVLRKLHETIFSR